MGELVTWTMSKDTLPLCCSDNPAFYVGDRRTLFIWCETTSVLNFSRVLGGPCLVCGRLVIGVIDCCSRRCFRIHPRENVKLCGKLTPLLFCGVFV